MQGDQNSNWTCGGDAKKKRKNSWIPWALIALVVLLGLFLYHHHMKKKAVTSIPENVAETVVEKEELAREELKFGMEHYLRDDFKEAHIALKSAWDKGNVDAKAIIGSMYVLGQGVPKETDKGMKMLDEASEHGSAFAKSTLGEWYVHGRHGLEKNTEKGLGLIQEAIDTGKYYGYVAKARLYEDGAGLDKDFDKAIEYLKEAGARGYERAGSDIEAINIKPKYETTAKLYASEYSIPEYMEQKYNGQKVRLTGKVKKVGTHAHNTQIALVELDTHGNPYTIVCEFEKNEKVRVENLVKGKTIVVQGIGSGHTDKVIHLKDCWFPDAQ